MILVRNVGDDRLGGRTSVVAVWSTGVRESTYIEIADGFFCLVLPECGNGLPHEDEPGVD